MLERVLQFAIERRVLVVFLTLALAALGVSSLKRLPIDAVPTSPTSKSRLTPNTPDSLRPRLSSR